MEGIKSAEETLDWNCFTKSDLIEMGSTGRDSTYSIIKPSLQFARLNTKSGFL